MTSTQQRQTLLSLIAQACLDGARLQMDFTRFNRHLLRSKLNWRVSHEESQIPGAIQS